MGFYSKSEGNVYAPGWFLQHPELCERETRMVGVRIGGGGQMGEISNVDGKRFVRMGTVYPKYGSDAEGFVYEDVDVTSDGYVPASVVTRGTVDVTRLDYQLNSTTANALMEKGFVLVGYEEAVSPA